MNWKIEQASDKRITNEMHQEVKRFSKGDIVYALAPSVANLKINKKKFVMDYIGPLAIAEVLDDTHYKLQLINDNKDILPGIWHINRLKQGAEMSSILWTLMQIRIKENLSNTLLFTIMSQYFIF